MVHSNLRERGPQKSEKLEGLTGIVMAESWNAKSLLMTRQFYPKNLNGFEHEQAEVAEAQPMMLEKNIHFMSPSE